MRYFGYICIAQGPPIVNLDLGSYHHPLIDKLLYFIMFHCVLLWNMFQKAA